MALVNLATPHIAGYSLEGKTNGTQMVFDAFLQSQGKSGQQSQKPEVKCQALGDSVSLEEAILLSYDVCEDDRRMRAVLADLVTAEAVGLAFDQLRKTYPVRREFGFYSVSSEDKNFKRLGFSQSL